MVWIFLTPSPKKSIISWEDDNGKTSEPDDILHSSVYKSIEGRRTAADGAPDFLSGPIPPLNSTHLAMLTSQVLSTTFNTIWKLAYLMLRWSLLGSPMSYGSGQFYVEIYFTSAAAGRTANIRMYLPSYGLKRDRIMTSFNKLRMPHDRTFCIGDSSITYLGLQSSKIVMTEKSSL